LKIKQPGSQTGRPQGCGSKLESDAGLCYRYGVDAPDIQRLLKLRGSSMDMNLVREYFSLFEKEDLLDEWLEGLD
jgi:hypothetical protein